MPMHQSGLDSMPGLLEQLRLAQMNRAAMQTQQGQGGLGAAGPPMPIGMTPQNAPLPQLGPFVPPPIPAEDPTGQLLYQAQPMRTMSNEEGVAQAAQVPFTPGMREALNLPPPLDPDDPGRQPFGLMTPRGLAQTQNETGDMTFNEWTKAMMARNADAQAGQLPNVVGAWGGQSGNFRPTSTYSQLPKKTKRKIRDRATARREKVELARGARREGMTPSQFGPLNAIRQEIQANPTGIAAQMAMGGPEAVEVGMMPQRIQSEADIAEFTAIIQGLAAATTPEQIKALSKILESKAAASMPKSTKPAGRANLTDVVDFDVATPEGKKESDIKSWMESLGERYNFDNLTDEQAQEIRDTFRDHFDPKSKEDFLEWLKSPSRRANISVYNRWRKVLEQGGFETTPTPRLPPNLGGGASKVPGRQPWWHTI